MNKHNMLPILALASFGILAPAAVGVELQSTKRTVDAPADQAVGMFQAMEDEIIDVRFIPQDAARANVLVQNKTDRVLHIALPDAIAAVPVLAQFGQNGGGQDLFGGGGGQGGGNQSVGGGLNGGGQGMGQNGFGQNGMGQGNQFGNGFMRIPPAKMRKLTATTVCLEHGKPDPNPKIAYRMIPIEQYTDNAGIAELCKQLGRGEIKQNIAQAAAWHLANDLDWNELAKVNRIESRYLGKIPFFTKSELDQANEFVAKLPKSDDYR